MAAAPAAINGVVVGCERFEALRGEGLLDRALPLPFDARMLAALNIYKAV